MLAGLIGQGAQHLHFRRQLGETKLDDLVVEQRGAEGAARARIVGHLLDCILKRADAACCRPQPLFLKLHHLVRKAMPFLADAIALGHAHVLKIDLAGVR